MLHDVATGEAASGSAPVRHDPIADAGFRSVERVTVVIEGGRTRAEATGVLHRYTQTVPISLPTARRLVAAGVALHVEDRDR